MNGTRIGKILRRLSVLSIIAFFSYTLINKAINVTAFTLNIAKTGIIPAKLVDFVAFSVLLVELLCIILMLFKEKRGIQLSLLMMVMFTVYILILYTGGRYEVCGCGGILNGLHFFPHFLINVLIIILLIILLKK